MVYFVTLVCLGSQGSRGSSQDPLRFFMLSFMLLTGGFYWLSSWITMLFFVSQTLLRVDLPQDQTLRFNKYSNLIQEIKGLLHQDWNARIAHTLQERKNCMQLYVVLNHIHYLEIKGCKLHNKINYGQCHTSILDQL